MNNKKIGVFDSGVGGLTVLKGLQEALPEETFIYIGDNLHSPYGEKTHDQLLAYTTDIVQYFLKQEVKMIVLACNTTSCVVLEELRQLFDQVPMLGVTEATCEMVKKENFQKALIMATKATIESGAYQQRIGLDKTLGLACPSLVPLIENGADNQEIEVALHTLLDEPMAVCDSVVLGCTHYPIIAPQIKTLYPHIKMFSSSDAIIDEVKKYLHSHDAYALSKGKSVVYTTGDLEKFIKSAQSFFEFRYYDVQRLELEVE